MAFYSKHARPLMVGLAVGVLSSTAATGLCGSINYSTLNTGTMSEPEKSQYAAFQANLIASPYVKMTDVREEWDPALNGGVDTPLLTPPPPTAETIVTGPNSGGVRVGFQPQSYSQVKTNSINEFDLASRATQVRLAAFGVGSSSDPAIRGFGLDTVTITIGGDLSVWAPLAKPAQPYDSYAQANVAATYNLILQGVNWQNVPEVTRTFNLPLTLNTAGVETVHNSISVQAFGPGSKNLYTWYGNLTLDQNALRSAFGITDPEAVITQMSLSVASNISAVGVYGEGYAKVNNLGASVNGVAVQAVPEPPTIILAGLGAVAVVANGYRRKKQRRNEEADATGDETNETGAIALTA